MRSSGRCPDHWSSAMPPPRIQSDPTRGQPEDGDHGGVPVSWPTTPAFLPHPSPPPSPASQQEDTNENKWLLYKVSISDSSILYSVGPAPPSTAFSIAPNYLSIHDGGEGEEPSPSYLPPTTNLLFSSLKLVLLCLFIWGILEGKGEKKIGEGTVEIIYSQPWKWGGNINFYSWCVDPGFLKLQIITYVTK